MGCMRPRRPRALGLGLTRFVVHALYYPRESECELQVGEGTLLVEAKEASTSESLHWDTGSKSTHCAFKLTRYIHEVRAVP